MKWAEKDKITFTIHHRWADDVYYYTAVTSNGVELLKSRYYSTKQRAETGLQFLKDNING